MKMRLGVLLISAFLLFSMIGIVVVSAEENNTNVSIQTCSDSDNGINYYEKGTAQGGNQTINDACMANNPKQLSESYCENEVVKSAAYDCPNGCSDGACVCPTTRCDDGTVYGPEKCSVKENVCVCPSCPAPKPTACSAMPTCTGAKDTGQKDSDGCPIYSCQAQATPANFYISGVEGIKKTYSPSETLNLIIKGVEQDGTPATAEEGFNIQFYIDEWPLVSGQGSKGDNAYYKEGYWYGSIGVPEKLAGYRLQIFLYCSRDDSSCAKLYGMKGAQVENTYYFSVTKSTCSDSDGIDYYAKGFMKAGESDAGQYDACISNRELAEYYCDGNSGAKGVYACPQGCKDGACVKGEQISEKVFCGFMNSQQEQKCYTSEQNSRAACSGIGNCAAEIKGYKGEQITWKSSCGQYQYTTMDGNDEKISFDCTSGETNITQVLNKGFKKFYFQCYDGAESKSTGREACKSADYWKKFASNFCAAHCENDPKKCKQKYKNQEEIDKCLGKCGINSFSLGNECYLGEGLCKKEESTNDCCSRWAKENNIVTPECVGGWNIDDDKCSWSCKVEENVTETTTEPVLVCKDSCPLDGKCYDFGYRKSGKYCSDEGGFVEQKKNEACDNNFECASNVCVNSKCIDEGFLQKIMNWFKKMFGG